MISLELAKQLTSAAIKQAEQQEFNICVSVVDIAGLLVHFQRMDNAPLGSIDVAVKKARTAALFLTNSAELGTIAQPGGAIYTLEATNGDHQMAAYNAAKGAVVNLVRAMALDYGKYNIRVNNVCPAACATPMFLANPPAVIDKFNQANPLGRICTPKEVAEAMYFLASEASSSCNGINLPVSGGLELHTGQPIQ